MFDGGWLFSCLVGVGTDVDSCCPCGWLGIGYGVDVCLHVLVDLYAKGGALDSNVHVDVGDDDVDVDVDGGVDVTVDAVGLRLWRWLWLQLSL